jgi:hypothetical protein
MKNFEKYLIESKNTHMEHLEDMVLNGGADGARQALQFLQSFRDALSGRSPKKLNTTVKWDGAPAIFVGTDPSDGKFFVAKKGIFNKDPKVYKTKADVDADTSGDLADKLNLALKLLKGLNITGVIQGDFLYSGNDLKTATVDGVKYITFHPNTLVYAIPYDSTMGRKIRASSMGIVWHTQYRGTSFESMSASYGVNVKSLGQARGVWQIGAEYEDVSGTALMTQAESLAVTKHLSMAGKAFRKCNAMMMKNIASDEKLLMYVKVHHNTRIREGQEIKNPVAYTKSLVQFLMAKEAAEVKKLKTEAGQEKKKKAFEPIRKFIANSNMSQLAAIFELQMHLVHAKKLIITKMNEAAKAKVFLKTAKGFKITGEEGYVAIDHIAGAVKLVDRLEFSYANFSPEIIKGWQTDTRR